MNIDTVLIVLVSLLFCVICVAHRIHRICQYRAKLLNEISDAVLYDLNYAVRRNLPYFDSKWRYNKHDEVSYNKMLFQFWRSLDSFYPDKSFTKPKYPLV